MRAVRTLTAMAMLSVVVAACSSDSGSSSSSGPSISATATEFKFAPDSWTVSSGKGIELTFTNDGTIEHEFAVMKTPIASEDEFAEDKVLWEVEAAAGQTETVTIDDLAPGTYQIICGIPAHYNSGMKGELIVSG